MAVFGYYCFLVGSLRSIALFVPKPTSDTVCRRSFCRSPCAFDVHHHSDTHCSFLPLHQTHTLHAVPSFDTDDKQTESRQLHVTYRATMATSKFQKGPDLKRFMVRQHTFFGGKRAYLWKVMMSVRIRKSCQREGDAHTQILGSELIDNWECCYCRHHRFRHME